MNLIYPLPAERWQEYRELRLESLHESPNAFLDTVEQAQAETQERWLEKQRNMVFAESDHHLMGMLGFVKGDKPKTAHCVSLVSFFVQPTSRGKGVGAALLDYVIELIKQDPEVIKVELGVITTQQTALSLYQSRGFTQIGIRRQAVKVEGQFFDKILMELFLK